MVASTVLLSALVVSIVGWILIQQTRDGLLDNRVDQVVAEVGERDGADAASSSPSRRAPTSTRPASRRTWSSRSSPAAPPGASRWSCPRRSAPAAGSPTAARSSPRASTPAASPSRLQQHFDEPAATAWTYTDIATTRPIAGPARRARHRGGQPGDAAGRQPHLHALLPLLARRGARDDGAGHPGAPHGRRRCCCCWSPAWRGWWPARWSPRSGWPAASPSGWPPGQLQERLRVTGEDDLARLATSFNQMASNLQRQIRQLEELSRLQRRFVSDVSHELRTPLTTVRMAGDVLHDARASFDPGHRAGGRAAPDSSSTGSRRCSPTCSRSAASTPAPPCSRPRTSTSSTWPAGSST